MGDARAAITLVLNRATGEVVNLGAAVETASAFIRTKAFDMGQDAYVKFIERVISNIRDRADNPNLVLEVWGSDDEEYGFELFDTIFLDSEDPGYTDPPGCRYFQFVFRDSAIKRRWSIHGMSIFGEIAGEEF